MGAWDRAGEFAVPYKRAAEIAGITLRQLEYWASSGLVRPSIEERLSRANRVRLYTFQDMVELVVAARLRDQLSLQHIRKTVEFLRSDFESPLRELRFAVVGQEIFFQLPDGVWMGDRRPGQLVSPEVLDLAPIEAQIRQRSERSRADEGQIVKVRKVRSSKPVFAGTRVPVSAVMPYLARGLPDERILDAFPGLTAKDIAAARRITAA